MNTPAPDTLLHSPSLFHLAIPVTDLNEARRFYGGVLGCAEGRSTDTWVDFDFFGHQMSLHLGEPFTTTRTGKVGEHLVPMPTLVWCCCCPLGARWPSGCRRPGSTLCCHRKCALRASPANNGPCSFVTPLATRLRSKV